MHRRGQVGDSEGGSAVVDRVDEWIVDGEIELEAGWRSCWWWRDDGRDLEVIEDSAGDTLVGDEGGNAQAITAVGADENLDAGDAMDAAEERGPLEAGWAIWVVGRIAEGGRGGRSGSGGDGGGLGAAADEGRTTAGGGREGAEIANEVDARGRDQGAQAGDEFARRQDDFAAAVGERSLPRLPPGRVALRA